MRVGYINPIINYLYYINIEVNKTKNKKLKKRKKKKKKGTTMLFWARDCSQERERDKKRKAFQSAAVEISG